MTPAPEPVKAQMKAAGMLADVSHDDRHIAFRDLIDNDGTYQVHRLARLPTKSPSSNIPAAPPARPRARC